MHEALGRGKFEILAFPCNQFGNQEPGSCEEVAAFARRRYGARFTVFEKVDVNGPGTHAVFRYLKAATDTPHIHWNFGVYFLVDRTGHVEAFPRVHPSSLADRIRSEL
mmetsp:Transcript_19725/g.62096  ORF Transcript_19725/g.62096 Transcript_19725/m.62096 type:complete len:108 (+) Transcript_19725:364-687(+)